MHRVMRLLPVATAALLTVALASCSSSDDGQPTSTTAAAAGGGEDLRGVCPQTVVFQADWQPESEHGFLYNLVGPGYKPDKDKKKVTGPLVIDGANTGVDIEVRTGGPAVGFQPVPALMYTDKSINFGFVATDEAVQYSAKQPTTAVFTQMDVSPLAILWDKGTYPAFNTIADIGQTNAKVLYTKGLAYMDYLTGSGLLRSKQLDGSYTGAPDLFVANRGKAAVQGFITSEPYIYEHEIKAWGKPLTGQLVNDTGYPEYFSAVSIRAGDKDKLAPCMRKLVPILQKSQVEFLQKPDKAIKLILEMVKEYNTGWQYSPGLAEFTAKQMVVQGIAGNGRDKTLGNFQPDRVQRIINITKPIFVGQHKVIDDELTPDDIVTNQFIDPSIGLPSSGTN